MGTIESIVKHIQSLGYNQIPPDVVEITKKCILDTIAVTIAGSTAQGINRLVDLAKTWAGREECLIPIYGVKVPAPTAALINSTMGRARDFDDVHELSGSHISVATIPSAFILAEYCKSYEHGMTSGKDFITAVVLGSDLLIRLRLAGGKQAQIGISGDVFVPIAVAAEGSKILQLTATKAMNAMGIAYAQSSGNQQAHVEGVETVRLQQGLGVRAGILAVMLANIGITGAHDILEGEFGLYNVYTRGEFLPEELTKQLGVYFHNINNSLKPYPCCKMTHGSIYGLSQLICENNVKPDDIDAIIVYTNTPAYFICGHGDQKIAPKNIPDAQFSYYYTSALAVLQRAVSLDDFSTTAIRDPEVLAMAKKVNVVIDPEKDKQQEMVPIVDVELITKNGNRYRRKIVSVKGQPSHPMSFDDLSEKLEECARFSRRPLSGETLNEINNKVRNLEDLVDITGLLVYLK